MLLHKLFRTLLFESMKMESAHESNMDIHMQYVELQLVEYRL